VNDYNQYFKASSSPHHISLDATPRWAVWPEHGTVYFDTGVQSINIIRDIAHHTMKAIIQAEQLDGWKALPVKDLFEMEYWSLEQEKLKKGAAAKSMQGKIALVTGAASGIGKACVEQLLQEGAVVTALDIDTKIKEQFKRNDVFAKECDVVKKNREKEKKKTKNYRKCTSGISK